VACEVDQKNHSCKKFHPDIIRGGVDSHEMHGDTIHEEVAEVVGRTEEACEGTCEEEVWDATYEETNLRIADAAEGAGKT